jgi:hypothetical protein
MYPSQRQSIHWAGLGRLLLMLGIMIVLNGIWAYLLLELSMYLAGPLLAEKNLWTGAYENRAQLIITGGAAVGLGGNFWLFSQARQQGHRAEMLAVVLGAVWLVVACLLAYLSMLFAKGLLEMLQSMAYISHSLKR